MERKRPNPTLHSLLLSFVWNPVMQGEVKNAFVVKERWRRTPNSVEVTIDR